MIARHQNLTACGLAASLLPRDRSPQPGRNSQPPALPPPKPTSQPTSDDKAAEPVQPRARNEPGRAFCARNAPQRAARLRPSHPLAHRPRPPRIGQADPRRTREAAAHRRPARRDRRRVRLARHVAPRPREGTGARRRDLRRCLHGRRQCRRQRPAADRRPREATHRPVAPKSARSPATTWPPPAKSASLPRSKRSRTKPIRERRAALVAAIELMHPLVNGPLLAMLETNDANLRTDVATLLQRLAVPQAAPFLPANSASAEQAVRHRPRQLPARHASLRRRRIATRSSCGSGTMRPRSSHRSACRPTKRRSFGSHASPTNWPACGPTSRRPARRPWSSARSRRASPASTADRQSHRSPHFSPKPIRKC